MYVLLRMAPLEFLEGQHSELESSAGDARPCIEHHSAPFTRVGQPVDRSVATVLSDRGAYTEFLLKQVRHHPSDRDAPESEPVSVLGQSVLGAPGVEVRLII